MQAIMRYAIEGGSGTLTIGSINTEATTNYYTKIDNDEIRFVSITNGTETVISKMDNRSLIIDKVTAREELTIANSLTAKG